MVWSKHGIGPIVFVSNTPSPYQIDLFTAIARKRPVATYFHTSGQAAQNVNWKLDFPSWLHILPAVSAWKKIRYIAANHRDVLPGLLVLGGYREDGHITLMLWARFHGIPVWVWMEAPEPIPQISSGIRRFVKMVVRDVVSRLVLPLATGILAMDRRAEKAYLRYHSNVVRQPYAIESSLFIVRKAAQRRKPLKCLFIGQMIDRKGIDELKGAFSRISNKDAVLSLAGSGPRKAELEAFCAETGHQYLGFIQPQDLPRVLSEQDVFVFPSRYDGWAVVVAQAMAAGLPVISNSAVGAFADLVQGTNAGTECSQNVESLYNAVMRYVHEPGLVEEQGKLARELFMVSLSEANNAADAFIRLAK